MAKLRFQNFNVGVWWVIIIFSRAGVTLFMGMGTLTFWRQAILPKRYTGAIAPSGKMLADRMTDDAEIANAKVIVEFGPGTGVFTEAILSKKNPDAEFMALELNPEFVEATRRRCPQATVHHDCASNTLKYLKESGHDYCDTNISGLPWTIFEEAVQDEILDAAHKVLRPGGRFVTFVYMTSPLVPAGRKFLKEKLPSKFSRVTSGPCIWNNIPPSKVFVAEKE
jgi:phospholipid N-methyltransferase